MWDVKNADFIYKRFPRAEFSHLLDFTDKADDTNVFIAVPDGDNETFFDKDGSVLYNNSNAPKFKIHEFHYGTVYGVREDIYNLWHGVETSKNSNLLRKCDITKYMNVTSTPNKVKASRVFRVDDLLGVGEPIDVDISADKEIERIPAGDDPFSAPPISEELKDLVVELYKTDMRCVDIARKCNISKTSLFKIIKERR